MSVGLSVRRPLLSALVLGSLAWAPSLSAPAWGAITPLVEESFDTDPVTGGRAVVTAGDPSRFTFNNDGTLTAAYDSQLPTAKLAWDLGRTLHQNRDFSFTTSFTIQSAGFEAQENGFAQIGFGLVNSITTGNDRAGGGPAGGDAFDVVSFDYFPNVSTFSAQTLGVTVVESDTGNGFFSVIDFPFGPESDLGAESPLRLDTPLTAHIAYQASARTLTLTVSTAGGLIPINLVGQGDSGGGAGGLDDDTTTIENRLLQTSILFDGVGFQGFSVDQFALTLWEDTFRFPAEVSSVKATVVFDQFSVVPEPSSLVMAGALSLLLVVPRQRRRAVTAPKGC